MKPSSFESLNQAKFQTLEAKDMKFVYGGRIASCTASTTTYNGTTGTVTNDGDDSFKGECGGAR